MYQGVPKALPALPMKDAKYPAAERTASRPRKPIAAVTAKVQRAQPAVAADRSVAQHQKGAAGNQRKRPAFPAKKVSDVLPVFAPANIFHSPFTIQWIIGPTRAFARTAIQVV